MTFDNEIENITIFLCDPCYASFSKEQIREAINIILTDIFNEGFQQGLTQGKQS